jgi:hypothetical protein
VIRKKWWEKKAVESSSQWCVIRVAGNVKLDIYGRIVDSWGDSYKPCHLSNMPTGANLVCRSLTKHEAQSMCKLLNLEGELK